MSDPYDPDGDPAVRAMMAEKRTKLFLAVILGGGAVGFVVLVVVLATFMHGLPF